MNKEAIEARIQQLTADKEKSAQLTILLDGAIQDCEFWLAQIEGAAMAAPSPSDE